MCMLPCYNTAVNAILKTTRTTPIPQNPLINQTHGLCFISVPSNFRVL
jgi:hypothetical protein